jgi:hypothetical protein
MTEFSKIRLHFETTEFEAAWRQLKTQLIETEQFQAVRTAVRRTLAQTAQGGETSVEGLLIIGESGESKTFSLVQSIAEIESEGLVGTSQTAPNLLYLAAPYSGTTMALAQSIMAEAGTTVRQLPKPEDASRKLLGALSRRKIDVLAVDELSRVLNPQVHSKPSLRRESQLLWSLVISILDQPSGRPVILSGLPLILDTLTIEDPDPEKRKARTEAKRRLMILRLPPTNPSADAPLLEDVCQQYCDLLGVGSTISAADEIGGRLLHAADGAIGTALVIAQRAVALASVRPRGKLKRDDFIWVHQAWSSAVPTGNPFAVNDWHLIDTKVTAPRSAAEARIKPMDAK